MPENIDAFSYYPRLRKVKEYVEEHLEESITLKDAAEVATLEPTYFSRFFKQKTGETFSEWLNGKRIEKAQNLLAERDLSITDVAMQVGYESLRTFRRVFNRHTGLSPFEYKSQIQADLGHE